MVSAVATAGVPRVRRSARGKRLDAGLLFALAIGLCAAVPVIAATVRALADGWLPAGDQANIATRAHDVFTARSSLVGLHSDASAAVSHDVYSLGPMLFWLLAVPSRLSSPAWMTLTMGVLNTASIVGAVVLARRRGGRLLMLMTAAALVLMSRSLAPEVLHDVWNPSAGLFPFTLLIFLCWSLACGEYRLLPLTVLVASFVVQCQLAFVPPSLGLIAVAAAGLGLSLRRRGSDPGAERPRRRGVWPWALAAVVVAIACWTPPAIDQIEGHPGNLTWVVRAATANTSKLGPTVGWHAVVRALGVPPWWLRDPSSPWDRKYEVRTRSSAVATITTVLALVALLALAVVGVLRRRAELWTGALIALALCAGLFAVAEATPTKRVLAETLGYTLWWASPAGMFVWLVVAWGVAALLGELAPARLHPRTRVPALAATAGGAAIVAVLAAGVAAGARSDYHLPEYGPLARIYSGLHRGVPAGRTVRLLGFLGNNTFRFKQAARFAMLRRGIRPLSPGIDVRLGTWYDVDHRHYDCTVYVEDGARRPARSAVAVAHTRFDDSTGSYRLSVWVAPAGCPRSVANGAARPAA